MKIEATSRPVAIWLLTGVAMVVIQIALGGITRLTGSGLSITEWNVVTGALPPLTAADWAVEFAKYQQTPQFRLLNFDFTLQEFKYIFFWEWFHRFWARLIGIVFIIPFIYFLWTRQFKSTMIRPLLKVP
jgi:cytochrome c oxidase assembly protein subunit 15